MGAGDRYPQLLRTPRARWWRAALGLALAGLTLASGAVAVVLAASVLAALTGAVDDPFSEEGLSADTPIGLLANNLVIALMVPAAALAVHVVHRERVGWLASVTGRVRWALLGRLFVAALAVVVLFFGLSFLLPSSASADVDTPDASTFVALLGVILLTTPLQAAAEEVGFRGYLTQASASWFARPAVGTAVAGAVSALLFALAHGTQDAWLFGDRLAFGLVASWLAWRTGGLEAAIALHVANNLVSLVYTAATGSLEATLTASTLEWEFAVLDVAMMVAFAVVVDRLAPRWRVAVRRGPAHGVLSGPPAVGYPGPRPSTPPPAGGDKPWGMG
jgi:hypothetical protein